ncbi:DNA recombination protein RmuC [Methylocapsa sp. D3K7]|uniref:DNA recombination protein RmuC n=1 Tax=Methylocapsa sp. D3K7 TaxID=3041435 RepID=UPI00244EA6BC|nr:DNA recombination protein RmuC [Methylocapsa sp. D3K7]WGJ14121.1 DNA recombination protein RmuC [Methylocapsa sp. D3K7]
MERVVFTLNGTSIAAADLLLGAAGLALLLLVSIAWNLASRARMGRQEALASVERQREMFRAMEEISRQNAGLNGSVRSVAEVLGSRQADLARLVADRLDAVGTRVGAGLEASGKTAGDHLAKLNERLAVIDAAQARVAALTQEVVGLKDILANKQARGAFGQGRLEAIIRDGLPASAFEFQYTLSNNTRPDCVVRLPGDPRVMVIDAKFPLEAFTALRGAMSEEARKQASARVRADVSKHVRDIAERYFLAGETQDIAILFVPSESLYADLHEFFEDIIQKAHKSRIIIVSPSLLMMAVQVMQAIVRDARVREEAHVIQAEVRRLIEEVERLQTRVTKLDSHFKIAQEDVDQIITSAGKIARRGTRIDRMDFETPLPEISEGSFDKAAE